MRNLTKDFENKKMKQEALLKYGFTLKDNFYILEKNI